MPFSTSVAAHQSPQIIRAEKKIYPMADTDNSFLTVGHETLILGVLTEGLNIGHLILKTVVLRYLQFVYMVC